MAGLGAKLFTAFSKLTAAQVNGYLMDQSIMRFASTAARDAAFGGAGEPTLAEGMTCYLDDTNQIQSYNGSSWVGVASSSTVSNVSSGLVYIKTVALSAFSVNVQECFTSAYTDYRLIFSYTASTANAVYLRFLVGSTVQTGNILSSNFGTAQSAPTTIVGSSRSDQYAQFATGYTVYPSTAVIDVLSPQVVNYTSYAGFAQLGLSASDSYGVNLYGRNIATTQIDGFEITTGTGASVLSGNVTIYGYRKA